MNEKERAKRNRRSLQEGCPDIYNRFYAHLSDKEFLADMDEKYRIYHSHQVIEVTIHPDYLEFEGTQSHN
jgi:hypothetical protein